MDDSISQGPPFPRLPRLGEWTVTHAFGERQEEPLLVLNLLLIGLAISLEPIPLTAFILVLASKNGVRKGATFIFGWLASLAVVIAVTVLVTGNQPPKSNTAPSLAALAAKILIGAVLVYIAVTRWRKMSQPKPPKKTPKWQTGIDNMSPGLP